jgi:thymidine kinase
LAKKRVVLLRPKIDTRPFLSHSQKDTSWLKEVFVDNLSDFDTSDIDVIGIDESQFHHNLKEFCIKHSKTKEVLLAGLLATSECKMFDEVVGILPYCENIIKLNAICTSCGSENGSYTYFTGGQKTNDVEVGGQEKYTSLCGECYFRAIMMGRLTELMGKQPDRSSWCNEVEESVVFLKKHGKFLKETKYNV